MEIEELMGGWGLLRAQVFESERTGFNAPPRDERCCSTLSRLAGEPRAAARVGAIVLSWKDRLQWRSCGRLTEYLSGSKSDERILLERRGKSGRVESITFDHCAKLCSLSSSRLEGRTEGFYKEKGQKGSM